MEKNIPKATGLPEVATKLIDKLSYATGWIFTHDTPKRVAVKNYIEEIKKTNHSPLEKAALISNAKKIIKEYSNQHQVVKKAAEYLHDYANPEKVDNDWVSQFFDKAKMVSNEDFQEIWSRLLAEECNNPGSIPKSLLFILEKMERKEAEDFMKICSVTIKAFNEYAPLIFDINNESLAAIGLSFDSILQLEAMGLIKVSSGLFGSGFALVPDNHNKVNWVVSYFDNKMELPKNMEEFPVGRILFTKDGYALMKVVSPEAIKGFWEETVVPWAERMIKEHQERISQSNK